MQRTTHAKPSALAERVLLAVMRDPALDPDLRLSAAHVALVIQHYSPEQIDALDVRALLTPMQEHDCG